MILLAKELLEITTTISTTTKLSIAPVHGLLRCHLILAMLLQNVLFFLVSFASVIKWFSHTPNRDASEPPVVSWIFIVTLQSEVEEGVLFEDMPFLLSKYWDI